MLPPWLIDHPDLLVLAEAVVAYGGKAPEDALRTACFNDPTRGAAATDQLIALQLLQDGRLTKKTFDAVAKVFATDPEAPDLLARLCRYEGIVLQGWFLVPGDDGDTGLQARLSTILPLLALAVDRGVGRPAADAAAMALLARASVPDQPGLPTLQQLSALEVGAAEHSRSLERLNAAHANHATVLEALGQPDAAYEVLRRRLGPQAHHTHPRAALRLAHLAARGGRDNVALATLQRAWALRSDADPDLTVQVGLSLLQTGLEQGTDRAWLSRVAAELRTLTNLPDLDLLQAIVDDPEPHLAATAVHRAMVTATTSDTPLGPRPLARLTDRWVRLVRHDRVPLATQLAVVALAEGSRAGGQPAALTTWQLVAVFLAGWCSGATGASLALLAERADEATAHRWSFSSQAARSA